MARTLILMRHAKSSWEDHTVDHLRDLSDRGRSDARAAGAVLAERGLRPYVLTSPTRRTRATWEEMAAAGAQHHGQRDLEVLYDHDTDVVLDELQALPAKADTVLCLGHAPTTPQLVEALTEREQTAAWTGFDEGFPTAAMAVIEVDGEWSELGDKPGRLVDFLVPRG